MTAPELEFDSVYKAICRILDETTLNDPREIAETVAEMIPEDEKHRILVKALTNQVRSTMGSLRNTALSNAFIRPPDVPKVGGSIQSNPRPGPHITRQPRPSNRSKKVEGIRDWWQEMLRVRIYVSDGKWATLGECGVEELKFAEDFRRDQAQKEIAVAKKYLALRGLLDEYRVKTVADLPPEAARKVWVE